MERHADGVRHPGVAPPRLTPTDPGYEAEAVTGCGFRNRYSRIGRRLIRARIPRTVTLTVDRPRLRPFWDDVTFVTATIVDANGVPVPSGDHLVTFQVAGSGAIVAVDNADNASHEPFQASERKAYQRWCVAVVRATAVGAITLAASAPGLTGSTLEVRGAASRPR